MHEHLTPLTDVPQGLFWSAPTSIDSDFTADDPLALDYLNQQIGLLLFPGFTTRTNRAQYYAVVLYGLHVVQRAIEKYGLAGDDDTRMRLFERWERCWALATMEYRQGEIDRGDPDAMRGVRGVKRAWFKGTKHLPLDFELISRQSELGGLGAYLSSLRFHQLVGQGSLRVTPLAQDIVDAFWSEKQVRDMSAIYEEYVLAGMKPDVKTWARTNTSGRLTLKGLGLRSSLSSITEQKRTAQQERLWNILFALARNKGPLLLAQQLIAANDEGVQDPESLLDGMLRDRWGRLDADVKQLVALSLSFGRVARSLLNCFNKAYRHVQEDGWNSDYGAVAESAFSRESEEELGELTRALMNSPPVSRIDGLPFHGPGFMSLVRSIGDGSAIDKLQSVLSFHGQVQLTRRGAAPWLKRERSRLIMQLPGYSGFHTPAPFPPLKLNTVRQLLRDLGRLP